MKKKTLIFITMEIPYPCNSGGRKYTWERIMELKKQGYDIFLFSLKDIDEKIYEEEYDKYIVKSYFYDRKNKLKSAIKNLNLPFSVATRTNLEMKRDIEDFINNNKIDGIILDSILMGNNVVESNIPYILTQHNIEYKTFKNIGKKSKNIFKKIIFYREYKMVEIFEKKFYNKRFFNGITFISKDDKKFFEDKFGNISKFELIPIGVNFKKSQVQNVKNGRIVFTGKMDYQPNIDAVMWFSKNIFPRIKECVDYSEFYIVGKNPTKEVKQLENIEGIVVTGIVDSVDKYLNNSNIVVIPLLSGGGVKIKLFEALEYKNIVISTTKGIEGTEFIENEHFLLANNSEEFADKCIKCIKFYDEFKKIGEEGNKYMLKKYSWENIGQKYSCFIKKIIQGE